MNLNPVPLSATDVCPRRYEAPGSLFINHDKWREDGTCSFCGSANPAAFMAFAEAGGRIGPTDKNYKVYLYDSQTVKAPAVKFYFQHLPEADRDKFVYLHNAKKLTLGEPGYFYTLPFFCSIKVPEAANDER